MNLKFVLRQLGVVSFLIGGSMLFSLPWGLRALGGIPEFEWKGAIGLSLSILVCLICGLIFRYLGQGARGSIFRKEAIAIVGLSWILATILGALPYLFSGTFRAPGIPVSVWDALFESQSGFSTTGATVFDQLEDPALMSRSILFWRSMTHFLGGVGIMVLFVAILGHGSAGKAIMRTEMPGPKSANPQSRMQQTAWFLVYVYLALNAALALCLCLEGVSLFDSLCHAFGSIATGGFSTYNASVGHFANNTDLNAPLIEWTLIVFMFLGGTNFMLFYWCFMGRPEMLLRNTEWRTYIGIILLAAAAIWLTGHFNHDFDQYGMVKDRPIPSLNGDELEKTLENTNGEALTADITEQIPEKRQIPITTEIRFSMFQVVSIITTTGFGTDEFATWNSFSRGVLVMLMFCGSCAGSTAGGIKIIRLILGVKILGLEIEKFYRPNVVRSLWLNGEPLDQDLRSSFLTYFLGYMAVFFVGVLLILAVESQFSPDIRGSITSEHRLMEAVSCTMSAFNNVGPTYGSTYNFANFTWPSKFIFTWLMMFGRIEIFVLLALFSPSFWKKL